MGFVVQLPLALPPLASSILLLFLLGPYSVLGRLFSGALTDSMVGIVLAEIFVAAPFLIVAARSAFASRDAVLEDVAATLGHAPASRYLRVSLPLAWPAIRAGAILAWLRAFGEFGATVMVAYHPYSLPVYTYVLFGSQGLPAMMPLLVPILAIAALCVSLSLYLGGAPVGRAERETRGVTPAAHPQSREDDAGPVISHRIKPWAPTPRLALCLHKRLPGFELDLTWAPGARRLAIIGPSGLGKSLTLRLIAGLEAASVARVRLGASDLSTMPAEARRIAYIPQDYGLFLHLSVARQLIFPRHVNADRASYWLAQLGLNALLQRRPAQLSFGQRQRVALARALACDSPLLLFDEPFAALDTPRRRRLQQSLRGLQEEIAGVTVVVTHDPDEAALLADEILVMAEGRVLQQGATEVIFARPASRRVAELLGLENIGEGVVWAPGLIEAGKGVRLVAETRELAPGMRVMWRVAAAGVVPAADGAYRGELLGVERRRGEPFWRVRLSTYAPCDAHQGSNVSGAADDAYALELVSTGLHAMSPPSAATWRFAITPAAVSVWPARPA